VNAGSDPPEQRERFLKRHRACANGALLRTVSEEWKESAIEDFTAEARRRGGPVFTPVSRSASLR
jgi:hypothetical protein